MTNSLSDNKKIFCIRPFRKFEIMDEGNIYLCCPLQQSIEIGSILNQSVDDIWNGETALKVRKAIIDGDYSYCNPQLCPELQNNELGGELKLPFLRLEDIDDPDLRNAIEQKNPKLPYGPRYLVFSFDNSCNLSCPSCRSELFIENRQNKIDEIEKIFETINSDLLESAHIIRLSGGGDPFGSPFMRNWLFSLKESDIPQLKEIHIQTNGLLLTKNLWESLPKHVSSRITEIAISIDGATKKTHELNRRGSNFEVLYENMQFLSSIRSSTNIGPVTLQYVVQQNNYNELHLLDDICKKLNFDRINLFQILPWKTDTFCEKEYSEKAVHLKDHPEHQNLLEIFKEIKQKKDTRISLENLAYLLED